MADALNLTSLAVALRASRGLAAKADIAAIAGGLGLAASPIPVGDDCAAIPDGDGFTLFAIEGFINEFVAADPWFAGWCGVMVNLSDIAAMGGRPTAIVDALWANSAEAAEPIVAGMRAAATAYGVPIVGGHSNLKTAQSQLAVAVIGKARALLTSFDAVPGDRLIMAVDLRGAYREPFNNWQAALAAPPERLRGDLAALPEIAERGLSRAAKDISQAGIVGTAAMLAECSGVGIAIDLDAIPLPPGVDLSRWLLTFPSYGYLIAAKPDHVGAILSLFSARDIAAADIGVLTVGTAVSVMSGGRSETIIDFAERTLMGCGPVGEREAVP
ncbi:MAG: sll0787 family AIR synthase-like protein [Ancalomicrobiaceae bacterium]|nr:sll0787 family AIR synthase-like protein [Ancalomicrobiaceae bacterium]